MFKVKDQPSILMKTNIWVEKLKENENDDSEIPKFHSILKIVPKIDLKMSTKIVPKINLKLLLIKTINDLFQFRLNDSCIYPYIQQTTVLQVFPKKSLQFDLILVVFKTMLCSINLWRNVWKNLLWPSCCTFWIPKMCPLVLDEQGQDPIFPNDLL